MAGKDLLFKTGDGIFSYRVAGVLIHNGKVLLQRTAGDPAYAFPGGHVAFGEASEEALVREFREETGAAILPARLLWIGENFFPWGDRPCHQVAMYYLVELDGQAQIPLGGSFPTLDEGGKRIGLEFCWVAVEDLKDLLVYPLEAREKLAHLSDGVEKFTYREQG